jgi:hypothetical protein
MLFSIKSYMYNSILQEGLYLFMIIDFSLLLWIFIENYGGDRQARDNITHVVLLLHLSC